MASQKHTKQIGTFTARSADGDEYTINVFQDFIVAATRGGSQDVPGIKSLRTDNGQHVNWIEKGKYELVDSGLELLSDDPNAM